MNKNLLIGIAATLMPAWMQAQSEKPKNVLFIAVDDLNDWVGFLKGHPNTRTPNMDRLAQSGGLFRDAYCSAPLSRLIVRLRFPMPHVPRFFPVSVLPLPEFMEMPNLCVNLQY